MTHSKSLPKSPSLQNRLEQLTPKQRRFVEALPTASSQREAAIIAGYSPVGGNPDVKASQLVRNGNVKPAIDAIRRNVTNANVMSVVQRKERLSRLALPDPEHPDPMRAIDLLNRMENIYVDRAEVKAGVVVLVVKGFGGDEG